MSVEDRIKKKNLLLSYYGQSGGGGGGETATTTAAASPGSNNNGSIGASGGDSSSVSSLAMNQSTDNNLSTYSGGGGSSKDPYDINSSAFDSDLFLRRLIKEKPLTEIMDFENDVVKETKRLDSEMQTLVSENYNKFISATDTIRKMRSDFKKMEEEMESLVVNMGDITEFNEKINTTFKEKRQEITRLNGINNLLKKLQFLFDLPSKLNDFLEDKSTYARAVTYYCKAKKTLEHYKHMPTFRNIDDECLQIMSQLKELLYERIESIDESNQEELMESVNLLGQMGEPTEKLCERFMSRMEKSLSKDLAKLQHNIDIVAVAAATASSQIRQTTTKPMDVLEFVDYGCNNFLSNLTLNIQSFDIMFANNNPKYDFNEYIVSKNFDLDLARSNLNSLAKTYWLKFCDLIRKRFDVENNADENVVIVRAVDKFYRRIQSINKQIPNIDLSVEASNIALYAALSRVNFYLKLLKEHFNQCLVDLKQGVSLLGPSGSTNLSSISANSNNSRGHSLNNSDKKLQQMHDGTFKSIIEQIKSVLANLQAFIASDISFSIKIYFNEPFCKDYVRERLLISFLKHVASVTREYADGVHDPLPYATLLILSRLCLEFDSVAIDYLITLADEQFFINDKAGLTNKRELSEMFRDSAKLLINHYVRARGLNISQMIRKSVETRDWLNTIEPRNVRAVMKRIVEDLTSIDLQVGELFEPGSRKERSSDSSRNTFLTRQTQRSTAWSLNQQNPSSADSKLMNNIQKLFAEKIEIFCPVEFTKMSVLTGIVKITLKTFLECVRLKTFSKYGLQQIQVDCHYLQLYLWRFVNDENLVYILLEEILTSSINRCTDPQLMEPRVVELVAESL